MKDLNKLMGEYKDLEREQYVTQEPMSLDQVDALPEIEQLGAVSMNQEMESLPSDSNLGEASRLEGMMSELQGKGMEPQYMQDLGVERDAMQAEQDIEDDQIAIDGMSFKDAFNQHYEKHKDTPIEERPYMKWKDRDYLPYKAEEKNRKPAAISDRVKGLISDEGSASSIKKTTEYSGLKGKPNTKIIGTSDHGLYYDSEGKLTSGFGDLVTSENEVERLNNLTKEQALNKLQDNIKIHDKEAANLLRTHNIDTSEWSDSQKLAINDMVFQLGATKVSKFPKMLKALSDGDFKEAAKEAANSKWNTQSRNRVKNFQDRIVKSK